MSDSLRTLNGRIEGLTVQRSQEELVQTRADLSAGYGAAAMLALAGMAGAATGALLTTTGAADSVEFFACVVDGTRVAGRFSKVNFSDGDLVDIVGEPQSDGTFAAFAVRRPADQTLWMFPHCSRGTRGHWIYASKMVVWIFVAMEILTFLFFGSSELSAGQSFDSDAFLFLMGIGTVMSLSMGCYLPVRIARRWRPFVAKAEAIFSQLGYADPSRVDMDQENKKYWKRNGGRWPYLFTTGGPWIYRYVTDDLRSPERGDCQAANPAS